MKKLFLTIALTALLQPVFAQQQVKTVAAAKQAVEAAKEVTENPKKNTKPAPWIKLGQAYMDAYYAPQGNGWIGATEADLRVVMAKDRIQSTTKEVIGGKTYTRQKYNTKNYYFDESGRLAVIEVTKPAYKNTLQLALKAFKQAHAVDPKGKKTKDITAGIKTISEKYNEEAYSAYTLGKYGDASVKFELAARAAATEPYSFVDSSSIYNAAFTAWMEGNKLKDEEANKQYTRSEKLFKECVKMGYYGESGDVYSKLGDIADKLGDKKVSVEYLEEGFSKFPQSQGLLVGLINYYVSTGENADKLFTLLDAAKKNEPGNASLYYVEGSIHEKLGHIEEAMASYEKCAEINPAYEFGYIGKGVYLYNKAVDIQEKAQTEMDDAKYNALIAEFETTLKACIEPFENAFDVTKDAAIKQSVAEYLKNACYRFSSTDETCKAKYEQYSKFLKGE